MIDKYFDIIMTVLNSTLMCMAVLGIIGISMDTRMWIRKINERNQQKN
jgi:hypothetical protein